jgi:epoxyqueuosine reductase QueG
MNTAPAPTGAAEEWLRTRIADYVRTSPQNRLQRIDDSPMFDEPLVGYADGDDALFQQYKTIIGSFHLTPREIMAHELAGESAVEGPLSVVCWVLPITDATRASNRSRDMAPSRLWSHTRNDGEPFNDAVREHVVALLREAGYKAIAPPLTDLFRIYNEGIERPPASTWSERHAMYVAGLGTFSLSDGFITPRGIAMRCGSVVTNMPLTATPRPYADHYANCLYYAKGTCGICIARCPAGAITRQGHDKSLCSAYMSREFAPLKDEYAVTITGCGLCQTGVPCESAIPRQD